MSATGRRARWVRGGLVSLLGLLALALPAADLSPRVPDPWGPETFTGDIAVGSLALLLVVAGIWLARRDWEPRYLTRVVVRTYAATAVAAVLAGWATVLWVSGDPTQYVVAIDGVLIAALLTFATTVLDAERSRRARTARKRETEARELAEEVIDCADDPTVIVDGDGDIAWLNDAAATAFGTDREAAVARDRDAVIGATLDPVESTRTTGAADGLEYRVDADGRRPRCFRCRRHEIDEGLYAGGRIERYTDVTVERNAVDALETVATLPAPSDCGGPPRELLDAGRELLDAEYAAFTPADGERTVRANGIDAVGDSTPPLHERSLREVRTAGTVRTGLQRSERVDSVGGFEFDHDAASFDAFVAAPVDSGDGTVGVLTFLRRSREGFSEWERALTRLLAERAGERHADERYGRALEHERERLEFVNRIVRHNVLNGLNLVNARVDLLGDDIDDAEAAEHRSVVRSRVEEMTDLIDTIRAFMDAATDRRDRPLEPVPIRSVLEETLSEATERYDADFRIHDLPAGEARVDADQLTGEVVENVLSNAVEHNDTAEPTVEVWTTRSNERLPIDGASPGRTPSAVEGSRMASDGGRRSVERPTLTVHVADDGPGIPDAEKRRLLRHGDAELGDPGHGFGFYLVREMMESYGGAVAIRDNEPRGTVIELRFPIDDG